MLGRSAYGAFGSASPPAVQAYIAARTEGAERTRALAALASSFGLGTIIGPAIAPLFIFPPLGPGRAADRLRRDRRAGPRRGGAAACPTTRRKREARGPIVAYPSIGGGDAAGRRPRRARRAPAALARPARAALADRPAWSAATARRPLLGVIGFLVIDRLSVPLDHAQQWIAIVLMAGAGASLLAQWWLIPLLGLSPRQLVLWGSLLAAIGTFATGLRRQRLRADARLRARLAGLRPVPAGLHQRRLARGRRSTSRMRWRAWSPRSNGMAYVAAPAIGVGALRLALPLAFPRHRRADARPRRLDGAAAQALRPPRGEHARAR